MYSAKRSYIVSINDELFVKQAVYLHMNRTRTLKGSKKEEEEDKKVEEGKLYILNPAARPPLKLVSRQTEVCLQGRCLPHLRTSRFPVQAFSRFVASPSRPATSPLP